MYCLVKLRHCTFAGLQPTTRVRADDSRSPKGNSFPLEVGLCCLQEGTDRLPAVQHHVLSRGIGPQSLLALRVRELRVQGSLQASGDCILEVIQGPGKALSMSACVQEEGCKKVTVTVVGFSDLTRK